MLDGYGVASLAHCCRIPVAKGESSSISASPTASGFWVSEVLGWQSEGASSIGVSSELLELATCAGILTGVKPTGAKPPAEDDGRMKALCFGGALLQDPYPNGIAVEDFLRFILCLVIRLWEDLGTAKYLRGGDLLWVTAMPERDFSPSMLLGLRFCVNTGVAGIVCVGDALCSSV